MEPIRIDRQTGIMYRQWGASSPRAVLLLIHGLGAHSGRWTFLADFFCQHSFISYALELRGFGETKDLKGHIDSFDIYLNDIRRLYDIAAHENVDKKIFLLGESLGAVIAFLSVISEPGLFKGLVCISPAFANNMQISFFNYVKIFSPLLYNPKRQFKIPFNAQMCTRDVDYQKKMVTDFREHRLATSKFVFNATMAQKRARLLSGKLSMPVLFMLAGIDKLVNTQVSKEVFDGLKVEDKSIIQYPGMYHALSIDLEKEVVFRDILKWLDGRIK